MKHTQKKTLRGSPSGNELGYEMPEVARKLHCVKDYALQALPGASNPTTVQSSEIRDGCMSCPAVILS